MHSKPTQYQIALERPEYQSTTQLLETMPDEAVLERAATILKSRIKRHAKPMTNPDLMRRFLSTHLADHKSEIFGVIWLDNRHRMIETQTLFNGTIDGAAVYPREVVRAALAANAAAAVIYHNHPSGTPEPSSADLQMTDQLKQALAVIDVRLLDHFVVGEGADNAHSMAENGQL